MDGSIVLHHEENEDGNPSEVMARRLKNRERQRRYRAKKRHEADLRKSQSTPMHHYSQMMMPTGFVSVPVEVEISLNLAPPDHVTRVHCLRDWKKDARNKKRELSPDGTSADAPDSDSNATHGSLLKRHWKAEARNKKQVENEGEEVAGV